MKDPIKLKDQFGHEYELTCFPKRVGLEISTACNARCITCPHDRIERRREMPWRTIQRVLEQCQDFRTEVVHIEFHNYNEPLLSDNFWRAAELGNDLLGEGKLAVVTNGSVLTEEASERLIGLKPIFVICSVDGFSKQTFEAVRKGLDRDRVYANVETFCRIAERLRMKTKPIISYTLCRENAHEVLEFVQHWSQFYATPHISFQDGRREDRDPLSRSFEEACPAVFERLTVLSDGTCVPCCQDWSGVAPLGNVEKHPISRIWLDEPYMHLRSLHVLGRKRDHPLCGGCSTRF